MLLGCFHKSPAVSVSIPASVSDPNISADRNVLLRQRLISMNASRDDQESQGESKMDFAALVMMAMKEKRESIGKGSDTGSPPPPSFLQPNYAHGKSFKDIARKARVSLTAKLESGSSPEDGPKAIPAVMGPKTFKGLARKAAGQPDKPLTPFSAILRQLKEKDAEEASKATKKSSPTRPEKHLKVSGMNSESPAVPITSVQHNESWKLLGQTQSHNVPNVNAGIGKPYTRCQERPLKISTVLKQQDSIQSRKPLIRQYEIQEIESDITPSETRGQDLPLQPMGNGLVSINDECDWPNGHESLSETNSLLEPEHFV